MTYYKRQNNVFLKTLTVGAFSLLLAACDSGSSTNSTESTEAASTTETTAPSAPLEKVAIEYSAEEVVNGVALGEITMGSPDAPITMIEYGSLTCSHCAAFHKDSYKKIKENYVDTGRIKFVFRNLVANQYDLTASMISRCAGPQKSWGMMSLFFERQAQWLQEDYVDSLATLARRAGMNRAKFDACLQNTDLQRSLIGLRDLANSDNVTSTPTFFIGDEVLLGAAPYEDFVEFIEDNM